MENIAIVSKEIIDEIRANQSLILQKIEKIQGESDEKYIKATTAAKLLECDTQTIANLEKEGLITRYGRGRFIRYSVEQIKKMMSGARAKN